jgi:hypothetical protein
MGALGAGLDTLRVRGVNCREGVDGTDGEREGRGGGADLGPTPLLGWGDARNKGLEDRALT